MLFPPNEGDSILDDLRSKITKAAEALRRLRAENDSLRQELEGVKTRLSRLDGERKELRECVEELGRELDEAQE